MSFDEPDLPYQRHSETSREAAEEALPNAGTQRRKVFDLIRSYDDGLTDEEVQRLLSMNPSTQRPRRIELVKAGKVVDSGVTRLTVSGRSAVVWKMAEAASEKSNDATAGNT